MIFFLGLSILGFCYVKLARYDKDDIVNAAMIFISQNSLMAFLRLQATMRIALLMMLYGACAVLTRWT